MNLNRRDLLRRFGAGFTALAGARAGLGDLMQAPSMITRRIPSSGKIIPVVGLGTWQTFDVGTSDAARATLEQVLTTFVQLGGRVIDSSPMYGSSE
ncbi:MAG: aldo/keto reductase, partial [Gemmatimonadota bacterium]